VEDPAYFAANPQAHDDVTQYWWKTERLTDGRAVIVIENSGDYSARATNKNVTVPTGLTDAEIKALKSASQLGSLLPPERQ
jgi:hypothetical protein